MDRALQVVTFAKRYIGRRFAWGDVDCTTIALAWLAEATGREWESLALGKYHDAASALAHQEAAGVTLAEVIAEAGGAVVAPHKMQPGDFILWNKEWTTSAIFLRGGVLVAVPDCDVCIVPRSRLEPDYYAMRVPCLPQS